MRERGEGEDLAQMLVHRDKEAEAELINLCAHSDKVETENETLRVQLAQAQEALEQAGDCIRNEQPEYMTTDDAQRNTLDKIHAALASITPAASTEDNP